MILVFSAIIGPPSQLELLNFVEFKQLRQISVSKGLSHQQIPVDRTHILAIFGKLYLKRRNKEKEPGT